MKEDKKFTFEEVFKQNERRIHYHIHKLGIRDPHREYFVEGIYALWTAYKKFEPDKGPMSTYFNFTIRNRLIDMIRKEEREQDKKQRLLEEAKTKLGSGNRNVRLDLLVQDEWNEEMDWKVMLEEVLNELPNLLTESQMKWVVGFCIEELTLQELAEREGVSIGAVKSWGREVRIKLRRLVK